MRASPLERANAATRWREGTQSVPSLRLQQRINDACVRREFCSPGAQTKPHEISVNNAEQHLLLLRWTNFWMRWTKIGHPRYQIARDPRIRTRDSAHRKTE